MQREEKISPSLLKTLPYNPGSDDQLQIDPVLHALTAPSIDFVALFAYTRRMNYEPEFFGKKLEQEIKKIPYATTSKISDLIGGITGCNTNRLKSSNWIINVPTLPDGPVTSEFCQLCPEKNNRILPLKPYSVRVILCPPDLFLKLYLNRKRIEEFGFIPGDPLKYHLSLYEAAIKLVSEGRFRPEIKKEGSQYVSSWVPALTPVENAWIIDFASSMPPLCRYTLSRKTKYKRVINPAARVYDTLSWMMQRVIHQALKENPPDIRPGKRMKEEQKNQLQFFSKLTGKDLHLDDHHMERPFAKEMSNWLDSPQRENSSKKFHLCIMLQEPKHEKDEPWMLTLNIRSDTDPSLIIPAAMIWKLTDNKTVFLPPASCLRQALLTDLAKAISVSSVIKKHFIGKCPKSAECSLEEISFFLVREAALFKEKGITLLLPAWWSERKVRPRIELNAWKKSSVDISPMLNMSTLIAFNYRVALGDQSISAEEFKKAAELKIPFIRIGGRWISYDSDSFKDAVKFIENKFIHGRPTVKDLLHLSLASGSDDDTLIDISAKDSWTSDILTIIKKDVEIPSVKINPSFTGILRRYQEDGVNFLVHCTERGFGACLADDMGLGKTPQTIAWILWLHENNRQKNPFLLICPMSVVGNWEREFLRFSPVLRIWIHHGSSRIKDEAFRHLLTDYDVIITTYQLSARDLSIFSKIIWAGVILDEAQNIKNPDTNQTQAIKKLQTERKVALTGTPVENRLVELWSIMDFLNPGYLGSRKSFQTRYTARIEQENDWDITEELRSLIRPFLIRRLKTDQKVISDLPLKMETKVYCTLTKEQATLYQAVVIDMSRTLDSITGIARKGAILAGITRLKQICNHPGLLARDKEINKDRSGKVSRLIEMLEEVTDEGDSALIFSQYAAFAEELTKMLKKHFSLSILLLTGSTSRIKREKLISAFQSENEPAIFVISLKAGGTGLNLTAATHVFHIDRWWNPAVENQATDRTYRIGQKNNVHVHLMIAAGTLEEQIDEMLTRKKSLAEGVLKMGEEFLTGLSTKELMDIVTLRDEIFSGEDE